MLTQFIWFNKNLKIDNTTGFFLILNDVTQQYLFINDLLDENNEFISFNRFKRNLWDINHIFTVYGNFTYATTNLEG